MPACPRCGAELSSGDPAGLCRMCLIQGALGSASGSDDLQIDAADPSPTLNDDFGRYRIIQAVGEGGMGTVYLAEQREPIRRSVALKVVKPGMDTAQVLTRFDHERQALALMDHPNIAHIFDAGASANGRPYFVMEYIEGAPHHAVLRSSPAAHPGAARVVPRGLPRRPPRARERCDSSRPEAVERARDGARRGGGGQSHRFRRRESQVSSAWIPLARWHSGSSAGRSRCPETRPRRRRPTSSSSACGGTQTLTSRS
jgi:Protein kinase domain